MDLGWLVSGRDGGWAMALAIVLVLTMAGVCITTVVLVSRNSRHAQTQLATSLSAGYDKLLSERHWQADNSIESKLAGQLTQAIQTLSASCDDATNKVMAYTQEGRDLVVARAQAREALDRAAIFQQQHDTLLRLLEVKGDPAPAAVSRPSARVETVASGTTVAHFGHDKEV